MKIPAPLTVPQRVLLGPGPCDVAPSVLSALGKPTLGHLDPLVLRAMDKLRGQMGEDAAGLGVIRDMEDPTLFGDPDRMTNANYYTGANDNGGVHSNSGVNNKAAYLMTAGGTFNSVTVTALGITKVAKIYYQAQTQLLTTGADYLDLYNALCQAYVRA